MPQTLWRWGGEKAIGCNPKDNFQGVRRIEHNEAYFGVAMVRIVLTVWQSRLGIAQCEHQLQEVKSFGF